VTSTYPEQQLRADDRGDQAARIAEMLDRWAREGSADDPEWDIADIRPRTIGRASDAI
jgi:hypothetical protein